MKRKAPRPSDTPMLEWLLGGVGAAIVAAGLGLLVHDGISSTDQVGELRSNVTQVVPAGDRFVVRYEVHNSGTQALSNLHVTARVLQGSNEVERASAMIDYLPGESSQEGGFYLRHDPRRYTVEIVPEGYQHP